MAKRKRLTPANPAFLGAAPETKSALEPMRSAPIADVAREASSAAAAEELAQTLTQAREGGRMVISVPLDRVQLDYLVRDRVAVQDDEMQTLKASLAARGQQTPVELVALEDGTYGLISGWRRCRALQALRHDTGEERFAEVLGLLRKPAEQAEAYVAMVEENEIRVGLSYFERARIVAKSVERGVFGHDREALQDLFAAASRAKRSKIGSFLPVVRALDGALRYPEALSERLGLALARALHVDTDLAGVLRARLEQAAPDSPEAEVALIEALIAGPVAEPAAPAAPLPAAKSEPAIESKTGSKTGETVPPAKPPAQSIPVVSGISLTEEKGQLILGGARVDEALKNRLITWLRQQY